MTEKPKLLFLKGLPASGKTTHAKKLEAEGWAWLNKDDMRNKMAGGYQRKDEKTIVSTERRLAEQWLTQGYNVVIDNTHFNDVHKEYYQELSERLGVEFEVLFFDTPLEECIRRNLKRHDSVPTEVIVGMYNKYIAPLREEHVTYNDNLEEAIVVDVDGTLAHMGNRNPYDASLAMDDTLDDAVSSIVAMAYGHGYRVLIVTGRHSGHLELTKAWLQKHGVDYDEIYCRQEGDERKDYIVKKEIFDNHIRDKYNIKYVIDDRPQVIRMWQSLGIKVLNVGKINVEF